MAHGAAHWHGMAAGSSMPAGMGASAERAGHAMMLVPTGGMLAAHVAAAVVLGLVLADGERTVFSLLALLAWSARPLARWYRHFVAVAALVLGPEPGLSGLLTARRRCEGMGWLLSPQRSMVRSVPRRGPPALLSYA
jgi:hypothetical protein